MLDDWTSMELLLGEVIIENLNDIFGPMLNGLEVALDDLPSRATRHDHITALSTNFQAWKLCLLRADPVTKMKVGIVYEVEMLTTAARPNNEAAAVLEPRRKPL